MLNTVYNILSTRYLKYIKDGDDEIFNKISVEINNAIDIIICFAKDTYQCFFSREEAKTIKSVMEAFGKDKEDYRAIGTFHVFAADK